MSYYKLINIKNIYKTALIYINMWAIIVWLYIIRRHYIEAIKTRTN